MKVWANDIGPNLARLRLRRGLTQEQFAAQLQVLGYDFSRQVIANIESRRRRVFEDHLRAFIRVLRCTLDELFFGVSLVSTTHPARR